MSGIQRLAKVSPSPFSESDGDYDFNDLVSSSGDSTAEVILDHGSFVGLGVYLSDTGATLTVSAGMEKDSTPATVTMNGAGTSFRYPDTDGINILYNARYVKLEWTAGAMKVLQKG